IRTALSGNSTMFYPAQAPFGTKKEEARSRRGTLLYLVRVKLISYSTTVPKISLSVSLPTIRLETGTTTLIAKNGSFDCRSDGLSARSHWTTMMAKSDTRHMRPTSCYRANDGATGESKGRLEASSG